MFRWWQIVLFQHSPNEPLTISTYLWDFLTFSWDSWLLHDRLNNTQGSVSVYKLHFLSVLLNFCSQLIQTLFYPETIYNFRHSCTLIPLIKYISSFRQGSPCRVLKQFLSLNPILRLILNQLRLIWLLFKFYFPNPTLQQTRQIVPLRTVFKMLLMFQSMSLSKSVTLHFVLIV